MINSIEDIISLSRCNTLVMLLDEVHPIRRILDYGEIYTRNGTLRLKDMSTPALRDNFVAAFNHIEDLYFEQGLGGLTRERVEHYFREWRLIEYMLMVDPVHFDRLVREYIDRHQLEFVVECRSTYMARLIGDEIVGGNYPHIRSTHSNDNVLYLVMHKYDHRFRFCPATRLDNGFMLLPSLTTKWEDEILAGHPNRPIKPRLFSYG